MKTELTLKQWMWMHKLIGETQEMLECAAIQLTEEQKHMISPFRCLVEQWEEFLHEIKKENKK